MDSFLFHLTRALEIISTPLFFLLSPLDIHNRALILAFKNLPCGVTADRQK